MPGEDLEAFAGAGLYDSVPLTPLEHVAVDYGAERLLWDPAFRDKLLGCVTKLGVEVEGAFGGAPQVGAGWVGVFGCVPAWVGGFGGEGGRGHDGWGTGRSAAGGWARHGRCGVSARQGWWGVSRKREAASGTHSAACAAL